MKRPWTIIFIVVALIFFGLAAYYWTTKAGSLPHYFPGYEAGSAHIHLKHGLAALILGIGSLILAWFSSGRRDKTSAPKNTETD
jgi:NADH:ubiquinone oxidoreductase subunit 5 (subunit L)/multisubunit Na+/H+ antiporter MnhA subunit